MVHRIPSSGWGGQALAVWAEPSWSPCGGCANKLRVESKLAVVFNNIVSKNSRTVSISPIRLPWSNQLSDAATPDQSTNLTPNKLQTIL